MKYVIIGNGVAGTEAALAIRKNDPDGEIIIVSASKNLFYYRPKLIDYLSGETTREKITIYKADFYEKSRIKNLLDTRVVKVNPDDKTLADNRGAVHSYDRLLIATGADCFVPPVKGTELRGVFTLRGMTDADEIIRYCSGINDVVIMGGGLLGLETANSLRLTGKKVTVIEFLERLLPRQLDGDGAELLKRLLEEKGLSFILQETLAAIEGDGKAERAVLKSGKEVKAGAVIISAGIRGRDGLARECGIRLNRGILVDDLMRTSASDIYAAGDPIEHNGCSYGIWPAAREQGRVAGLNMAGIETKYAGTVMSNVLKITGIDLFSAGNFNAGDAEKHVSKESRVYRKCLMKEGRPVGAIVLGDPEAVRAAQKLMEGKAAPEEFLKYFV